MKDRLRQLRKELGLTQREFAGKIGIKPNTFSQYESGRNEPIDAVIQLICSTFQVSEEWLRHGAGEMFVQRDPYDEIYKMVDDMLRDESADIKRRLITALLRLDAERINSFVDWMLETFGPVPAAPDPRDPTIDEKVAAYRAELEAQEALRKSEVLPTTSEKEA